MKPLTHILTAILLLRLAVAPALAQDTLSTRTAQGPAPLLCSPVQASLMGLALTAGASPMFVEPLRRQNILVREEVQLWRRNRFDHRQLHFDDFLQLAPLASVVLLDWCGVPSRHDGWPLLRRTAGTMLITTAIVQPLKLCITEWRPDRSASNSFPSGHTAFAFSGAELLRLEYGDTSPWIPAAGFAIAAFTGFMRLYNDRHWTGDVLAGAAVGIISADISFWLNNLIERKLWNR